MKSYGICGGIGAGKSVVSRYFRAAGYSVYDTDLEARRLMEESREIHARLCDVIHPQAVTDGVIDRQLIAREVFDCKEKLSQLNNIVHTALKENLATWLEAHRDEEFVFVECALMFTAGIYKMVDETIQVVAPEELRIVRVMKRNGLSREQVISRLQSQQEEENLAAQHSTLHIINDNETALLPQLVSIR